MFQANYCNFCLFSSSFHLATMNWSACHKYANWTIWRFWICPIITLNSWMVWRSSNFCHGLDWPTTRSRLFSNWINVFILNIWIYPGTSSSIWTICPSSKISRYVVFTSSLKSWSTLYRPGQPNWEFWLWIFHSVKI